MPRRYISQAMRSAVLNRANHCCEYCKARADYAFHTFTIDHIIPLSEHGSEDLDNYALACRNCNSCKHQQTSGEDPISGLQVPLFNPRSQSWSAHFSWSTDKTEVLGITAVGRATIFTLRMNRTAVVNLRLLLTKSGLHPPS